LPGRKFVDVLLAIFDDGHLQREPDLRRRQADSGSATHSFEHAADQILNRSGNDLVGAQRPGGPSKDRLTGFTKLENHFSAILARQPRI